MGLARRIGIVGTFDVENFGDLLFPIVAEAELARRLPGMTLTAYSYHRKATPEWAYDVSSLEDLAREIETLDLLIVGGGHLIRFDKYVAEGYGPPPALDLHHPTGYWLMPTLLAAGVGVPVVWNALGATPDTPTWAQPLLRVGVESAELVTVREQGSVDELERISAAAPVQLVPDSVFGLPAVLPGAPSAAYERWLTEWGLEGPYVIVQPSPHLRGRRDEIATELAAAAALGYLILELPISPVLGDEVGLLDLGPAVETVRPARWPEPLLLAEIIAGADAIVARSLHASITALVSGVPVHRFRSDPDPKYRILDSLEGVALWDESATSGRVTERLGRVTPASDVREMQSRLARYWDEVAGVAERSSTGDRRGEQLASLIGRLTTSLEESGR